MSRIVDVEPLDCLAWKDGEHGTTFDDGVLWVLEKIGELPTIEPQRWIPCSEGLPDRFGQVLCAFIPSGGTLWTSVIIANYSDLMGISKPCFWIGDVGKNSFQNITKQVTAWMPLPKPYKGDET